MGIIDAFVNKKYFIIFVVLKFFVESKVEDLLGNKNYKIFYWFYISRIFSPSLKNQKKCFKFVVFLIVVVPIGGWAFF